MHTLLGSTEVTFIQSESKVDIYKFIEVIISVRSPKVSNPFTNSRVEGIITNENGEAVTVEGFCDSQDGSRFMIRFMPKKPGKYTYSVSYHDTDGLNANSDGEFTAVHVNCKGILRTDHEHPWHFKWENSGDFCFLNGTTCYYLMGFEDEKIIQRSIDRLHLNKINRIRVLLYGRQTDMPWRMPLKNNQGFSMRLNPWNAKFPNDPYNPEFDLTRFNLPHWQKFERLLEYARDKEMQVSVIFFIGAQCLPTPFMQGSEDELRYYRYGVARLAAYSNVNWDIGNEHDFHRETAHWPRMTGEYIKFADPYHHLKGSHNKAYFDDWLDMQLIQSWDAGLNDYLIKQRQEQKMSGRIVPQIIEEYGYEDLWEQHSGQRNADSRRRCAWEIYMAGGYQTNGESARTGTGMLEDTGGGWVNGRGDDSMTMFKSYVHIVDFFTSFQWWKTEPRNDLVTCYLNWRDNSKSYYLNGGNLYKDYKSFCLAEPGKIFVFYLPRGGNIVATLDDGKYAIIRFNPRTGETTDLGYFEGSLWTSPNLPDDEDWVYKLTR